MYGQALVAAVEPAGGRGFAVGAGARGSPGQKARKDVPGVGVRGDTSGACMVRSEQKLSMCEHE